MNLFLLQNLDGNTIFLRFYLDMACWVVVRLTSLSWVISQSHQPSSCCWDSSSSCLIVLRCSGNVVTRYQTWLGSANCCNNNEMRAVKAVIQRGDWRGWWSVSPSQGQCECVSSWPGYTDWLTWYWARKDQDHSNIITHQDQSYLPIIDCISVCLLLPS